MQIKHLYLLSDVYQIPLGERYFIFDGMDKIAPSLESAIKEATRHLDQVLVTSKWTTFSYLLLAVHRSNNAD